MFGEVQDPTRGIFLGAKTAREELLGVAEDRWRSRRGPSQLRRAWERCPGGVPGDPRGCEVLRAAEGGPARGSRRGDALPPRLASATRRGGSPELYSEDSSHFRHKQPPFCLSRPLLSCRAREGGVGSSPQTTLKTSSFFTRITCQSLVATFLLSEAEALRSRAPPNCDEKKFWNPPPPRFPFLYNL